MAVQIRIPKTSTQRGHDGFVKLIERFDPNASDGFGVHGRFLKPGALVDEACLRPTPAFPAVPVLVEYVRGGNAKLERGWRRHNQPDLYLLWRRNGEEWLEVARSLSTHGSWVLELGPIMRRTLDEARGPQPVRSTRDAEAAIAAAMDQALEGLGPSDQRAVLAALHDEIAVRIVRVAA